MKTFPQVLALAFGLLLVLPPAGLAATRYVEGDVIVTFKTAATLQTATAALKKRSLAFTRRFSALSAKRKRQTGLVHDGKKTTAQLIAELKTDANVETVEPNYIRWVNAEPNDTRFAEMWALKNSGQTVNGVTGTASDDVKFVAARSLARPPLGEIVVGVIDTGVDTVHPDLAARIWVNPLETPFNGTDDDGDGYRDDYHGYDFAGSRADPTDSGYHGTHVTGTIAAIGDNHAGVIGVNDKVRFLPLKVSTDGETIVSSAEIAALEYATLLKKRGVNIVALNASFGGGGNSSAESAAIQAAGDAGIILCVAAGNSSANNDTTPSYPASYRLSNMIVVAATDQNDALASYSNYGAATVDIAAPGSNILSTKPSTVSLQVNGTVYSSAALTYSGLTTGLSGSIIDCGSGNSASEFPASVKGNVALIMRGTQTFAAKVTFAMAAGAKAAIVYNNASGSFSGTLGADGNWIPAYSISQADGQAIKAALPKTGALVVTGNYQFLDGTSMATPHVTGAVSFAAMSFPGDTLAQRRARVLASVDVKAALQGKVVTGGRLDLLRIVDADGNGAADWQPVITTAALPQAINGQAYSQTLAATGGSAPYVWSVAGGSLPSGFSLSSAGILGGTSNTPGDYVLTAQVTDSLGTVATQTFSLTIATDHFTWDYAPALVYAGSPFAVKLTERDSMEQAIATASGTVNLTATARGLSVPISPATVTLNAGSFLGYLTIGAAAADVTITATRSGLSGTSASFTANSGTSTANDGIPDSWKTANGLDAATNGASLDSDGDGLTNQQEYAAGTDPLSVSSSLKVTSTSTDGRTYFTVSFPGVAGKLYRISTSSDLMSWTSAAPAVLPAVTGPQSVTVPLNGDSKAFFRVDIMP